MTTPKKPPKKAAAGQKKCQKCDELKKELEKFRELAGRAQADLQNAKDRLQKEAGEMRKFALENTLLTLLPTIDNFQRAFAHLPENHKNHEWVKGLSAIEQDFMRQLSGMGLSKMECLGEVVDPQKHEVLQTGPGEEGKVVEIFEDGYLFNGKVLKPAKVRVGGGKEATEAEEAKA